MNVSQGSSPNRLILTILRLGVVGSFVLLVLGLFLFIKDNWSLNILGMDAGSLIRLLDAGEMGLDGSSVNVSANAWMNAGLWLLIFTPLVRVFLSCIHFAKTRDRFYFRITLLVLGLLVASIFLGVVESH